MRNLIVIAGLAASIALASSAQAGVNLVVNGQFASPALSPGQWSGNVGDGLTGFNGWYNDNPRDWVEIGKSSVYGLSAAPGNSQGQNLEVSGNASPATVYQTIDNLTIGQVYNVSWLYGGRVGSTGANTYTDVSFGGTKLATDTGSSGVWTANSFDIVATATSEKLSFTGYTPFCGGTCGNEITNVSVSGVPEPSTWAMMLVGFGALAFAGYRRKGAVAA
jgi:hypothetical protein